MEGYILFCKVVSKSALHKEVILKQERYGKRYNRFDIAEGFPMEFQTHQNVKKFFKFYSNL